MRTKKLTAACMIVALATGFATASFANGEGGEEGCITDCGPEPKGNNGWGNGVDGPNPGTDKGNAQQVSTKQNTSPPAYDLDKVLRFGGR